MCFTNLNKAKNEIVSSSSSRVKLVERSEGSHSSTVYVIPMHILHLSMYSVRIITS